MTNPIEQIGPSCDKSPYVRFRAFLLVLGILSSSTNLAHSRNRSDSIVFAPPQLSVYAFFDHLRSCIQSDKKFDLAKWNEKQEATYSFEFEGWNVQGRRLAELAVWISQPGGPSRSHFEKSSNEFTYPITKHPILLNDENRKFFDELADEAVQWNGTEVGFEYLLDPASLGFEGDPVPFYLIRKASQDFPGKIPLASLSEISQAYLEKAFRSLLTDSTEVKNRFQKKAKGALEKLGASGDADSLFFLGQFAEKGWVDPQDFSSAEGFYKEAASRGSSKAQEALDRKGFHEFVQIWKDANEGHSSAQRALGEAYLLGNAWVKQDFENAAKWLKKDWVEFLKTAENGSPETQFGVGVILAEPEVSSATLTNELGAKRFFKKAADQGLKAAKDYLDDLNDPTRKINRRLRKFGIQVVELPGGTFMMGDPKKKTKRKWLRTGINARLESQKVTINEAPFLVEISPFWVMDTKLTREQWKKIMGEDPRSAPYRIPMWTTCRTCPMTNVNWNQAQQLIKKLAGMGIYSDLPTEAQQEYYMRLGYSETGIAQTDFPWGENEEDLEKYAWVFKNSGRHVHPVGTTEVSANAFGMKDVLGNVMEFSSSWYGDYPKNKKRGLTRKPVAVKDPQGPDQGETRVMRGCGWVAPPTACRVSSRYWAKLTNAGNVVGFRLVFFPGSSKK